MDLESDDVGKSDSSVQKNNELETSESLFLLAYSLMRQISCVTVKFNQKQMNIPYCSGTTPLVFLRLKKQ